ncbi:hypothetical protein EDD18DRAFT_1331947 [Armillaria luteobubalina]|uniref:F-box domain-containing protein n=1 Tax=Armillaria luteobubalina TaxID=153913 RepID=A0AA39Q6J3_9AGAR|nr:hypothetical protein EDD18DRAFT_1331947 [Armillaria luteobubalina]
MSSFTFAQEKFSFDIDETALGEDIVLMQKTVSNLNHRLKHLATLISRIHEERAKIVTNLAAKRSLLSPIRRLNRDVLLLIFSNTSTSFDVKNAPWISLHVCHWWRPVTSSFLTLWSSVRLVKAHKSFFPLSDEVIEEALIAELVSHSSQWYCVYICTFAPVLGQLSKRLGNLSNLKKLRLEGLGGGEPDSDMFLMLPNSHRFAWMSIIEFYPPCFRYQIYNSTILSLPAVPHLEVLRVYSISKGQQTPPSNKPAPLLVTLPHLRQLSYLTSSETSAHFFETNAVHRLTHLHLEVDNSNVPGWISALTVTSSSCLLPNLSDLAVVALLLEDTELVVPDEAQHFLSMVRSRLPGSDVVNPSLKSCLKKI